MCCLEKKKGDGKKAERQGGGRGGLPCVLKTRKRGGEKEEQTGMEGVSGVAVSGGEGRLAGAVSAERGAELKKKAQAQLIT